MNTAGTADLTSRAPPPARGYQTGTPINALRPSSEPVESKIARKIKGSGARRCPPAPQALDRTQEVAGSSPASSTNRKRVANGGGTPVPFLTHAAPAWLSHPG